MLNEIISRKEEENSKGIEELRDRIVVATLKEIKRRLTNSSIDYRVCKFQTFDHPVLSRGEVLEDILGVDMETYAIVKKAKEYNIAPIVIKSVSDILHERKPLVFPTIRLIYRIFRNFKTAKKGLNDFGQNYFMPQTA